MRGKTRVACLSDGGVEGVEDARVLALASETFEADGEFMGITLRKLRNGADAKKVKIALDGRTDGDEVAELAWLGHWSSSLISLYFRHRLRQNLPHLW